MTRRPAIDVARVLALVVVVLGHLALAVIDHEAGEVRGANLLELRPGWAWIAAVAPMPVFFAAAGWANATATLRSGARRLASLVGAGAAVVVVWSTAVVVATVAAGGSGLVGRGARIATQPLWFLAAYVPFAASGRHLARLVRHRMVALVGGLLVLLAALDAARFAGDAPEVIGWLGFPVAWGVPWLLGASWRDRVERDGLHEVRVGALLAAGGATAAALLVHLAGYSAALIDAVPGARSNTTPPTLYTAVAGITQVGVLLVAARSLDAVGRRWTPLWDRAGTAAVGIYVWHLTGLALCAGVVALGLPVPERLTGVWWLTRPVWWAAVLAVTGLLVAIAAGVARAARRPSRPTDLPPTGVLVAGMVVATGGAALVGLEGPRSVPLAVACSALCGAGWWLLRGAPLRSAPGSVSVPGSSA